MENLNKMAVICAVVLIVILVTLLLFISCNGNKDCENDRSYQDEAFEHREPQIIPKQIFMTYKTKNIPDKVIANWKKLNPDYSVLLYDDKDCIEFLRTHFGQDYADYFKELPYGPIKSDFWRLCALYTHGGVYSDIDIEPLVPLKEFISGNIEFFSSLSIKKNTIFQAVIAVIPQHPVIRRSIELLYNKRGKTNKYWELSGTIDMYIALKEYLRVPKIHSRTYKLPSGRYVRIAMESCLLSLYSCAVKYGDKLLFKSRYEDYVLGGNLGKGGFFND